LCLSDFKRQFQDIYSQYEGKIKQYDAEFHAKFVSFYEETFNPSSAKKSQNFEQLIDIRSETAGSAKESNEAFTHEKQQKAAKE
jgi:hypothetical protein